MLGVSQPVISKKLQIFKDPNGCGALLLRSEPRLELTDAARAVLPAIRELIDRYDRILRYLHGDDTAPRAIRVGTGNFAAAHFLPAAIAALRTSLSDFQIETHVCRGRERIVGTAQGWLDLSLVTHDELQIRQVLAAERLDESRLKVERLGRQPMCVLARKDTPAGRELLDLSAERSIPLQRLTDWELIGPDRQSGLRRQLEQKLRDTRLYFITEGGGWYAAREYARQGIGVAILPLAVVAATDDATLVHRRLAADFDVATYLIHRDDLPPHLRQARKAIREAMMVRLDPS